jgi:transposase-like protein
MSQNITFKDICNVLAAVQCLNAGHSFERIAKSAKVSPATVRKWVKHGGFRKLDDQWVYSL